MKNKPAAPARKKARFGSRRGEVVALLQRGIRTVSDLALQLRLTDNAVRSHLLALEREGLVTRKGSQPGTRRPHEVYQLTSRAQNLLARASDASLSALLTAMKRRLPAKQLRALLEGGGEALAERFQTDGVDRALRARVQNATRLLNAFGGAARAEKTEEGFVIRSQGCPLAAVVAEHPETCQLMEDFLARVIRAPVREHCLRNGQSRCRFAVSFRT
jgi:predicted ArsR family transcriptional regulator